MNSSRRTILIILTGLGIIFLLVVMTYGNLMLAENFPAGKQFAVPWMAARAWVKEGISPYDFSIGDQIMNPQGNSGDQVIDYLGIVIPDESVELPVKLTPGRDYPQFSYPLFSMLFFAPFGLIDFSLALAVWMTVLEVCLVLLVLASIQLAKWELGIAWIILLVIFSLLWYYTATLIINGQVGVITALFVTLSLIFLLQKQDILTGIFLAFATLNPQMIVLLVPFILLWSLSVKRKDVVWSYLVTLIIMIMAFIILIPSWPISWFLRLYEMSTSTIPSDSPVVSIASNMPGIYLPVIILLYSVLLVYLFYEWILALGKDEQWFLWTAMLTIVISNLAGYKTGITNYVLFLPVLFLIFKVLEERWQAGGRFLAGITLLFLGVFIWVIILVLRQTFIEPVWVFFPLPLVSLLGLWWVRWWFIRPPQLLIDKMKKRTS